jgi:hypothetical protein
MAKLLLGKAPEFFPMPVKIQTPFGEDTIEFEAKHLGSIEWEETREAHSVRVNDAVRALFDAERKAAEEEYAQKEAKNKEPVSDDEKEAAIVALIKPVKGSLLAKLKTRLSAELLAKIVTKWDLEDAFNAAALESMCDKYQSSAETIFNRYGERLQGARLGN